MHERSTSTALPPLRRAPRRDWGKLVARVLCVMLALVALGPLGLGLLVRTSWARGLATTETRRVLASYAIDARYELRLKLWPLSLSLRNIRVESSDGGTPILTARSVTARPKIFGLLAGKLVIDEIEIERPAVRVVLRDGKLMNLAPKLPETPKQEGPTKPPFSVVSASDMALDLTVDERHVVAKGVDADVTTDDDGHGGAAFEVALRAAEVRHHAVRTITPPSGDKLGDYAVDEDIVCKIDGRARIESKRIVVRRFSAFGAADLAPGEETAGTCAIAPNDKRFVELQLGHFSVALPQKPDQLPAFDGHVKARAPLAIINRFAAKPDLDGWASVDVEVRAALDKFPDQQLQELVEATGHLEAQGIRLDKYSFARSINSDFTVRRGVVTSPLTRVEIADGVADIKDVEVRPFEAHRPLKATLEAHDVSFTSLMRDLGVSKHPHVTWDINQVRATNLKGTLDPLQLDGDLMAKTANFAVFDAAVDDPAKHRAMGVREGNLLGRVAIRPDALEFRNIQVTTTHSVVNNVLVSIGFHEILRVDVPAAKVDLGDISPLGSVAIAGMAELKANVSGLFGDPHIEGDVASIKDFAIGKKPDDIQFGTVTQAHVSLEKLAVLLRDVRATKGKSAYEVPTAKLEFGGAATMVMDGTVTTKTLDVRDFLSVFHMDEDPRFEEIGGTLETNARMHLALGGPEDVCKGGFLDVQAVTTAHDLNLLGERFDEGQADLEYRWTDREAGIDGADIDVGWLALSKVK
jgi:translocation and assembly module TamB